MENVQTGDFRVAVLIPCFNEGVTIAKVVSDFRRVLPDAAVYVYDNNSTDNTAAVAEAAGAIVGTERQQGKGHVIRRMFSDIEADIYLMVDGDDTYDASAAPAMIEALIVSNLDMVTGLRQEVGNGAYRRGHRFGNRFLTSLVARVFGRRTKDMLSGYRAFSRRFVKSFPALSLGFELETELTVHALELDLPIMDVATKYRERPDGSLSKLNTYRDGARIIRMIFRLIREGRPLAFFSVLSGFLVLLSTVLIYPVIIDYMETGLVPRFPTAVLASAVMLTALLSLVSGFVLDAVTRGRRERKRLAYLSLPSLKAGSVARPEVKPTIDAKTGGPDA
ncbi:glycosyltransferase [Kordiimonas sp. SCSIO 12610]|uniref:glycosyltransferase n=1 Tax=Kordiimonas sp. SCSIO 12610 TaxID=2829597 RepID=UPI00351F4046